MAMPAAGASQPSRMPQTMAVSTQKYSCLYQRVLRAGVACAGGGDVIHDSYLVVE
jgi:hypothetical protein